MRLRDAIRRAVGYHLRALPPTAVGLGLAGAGIWYGLDGGTSLQAVTTARLAPAAGLLAAGVVVAAVGRTAVRLDATADAVAGRLDGGGMDEDDLRETVAIATERAVADSIDGATADIEARVADAVADAAADDGTDWTRDALRTGRSAPRQEDGGSDGGAGGTRTDDFPTGESPPTGESASRTETLGARGGEPDALADATRRASERVEAYLESEDDVGEFRQLAEGAAVMEDDSEPVTDDATILDETDADGDADARLAPDPERQTDAAEYDSTADAAGGDDDRPDDGDAAEPNGAEILEDDPADPDLPDGGEMDDAEIIDGDTEMVFGGDVRDPDES